MTLDERTTREPDGDAGASPGALARRHRRVGLVLAVVPVVMLGMAYAAVPLYQMFCRVTGYGGTTRVAVSAPEAVLDQTISIRFDGNVAAGLPWDFKPSVRTMEVRIGEPKVATYRAVNNSDVPVTGTAAFNVTPEAAGLYFNKIQCFCFTEQRLEPGQEMEMPVTFFVDPEIMKDKNTRHLSEITLSYTFFPMDDKNAVPGDKHASRVGAGGNGSGGGGGG